MAEKTYEKDENGIEVRSDAAKWLAPPVPDEDMTRVQVAEDGTYVYVDPASLFAMERLVAIWRAEGKVVKGRGQGFKKFVRETAEAAFPFWPAGGYVVRGPFTAPSGIADIAAATDDVPVEPPVTEDEAGDAVEPELPYPQVDDTPAAPLPPELPGLPTD